MTGSSVAAMADEVAAFGLPTREPHGARPIQGAAFTALLDECDADGILGLLAEAVRAGAWAVESDAHDALEARLRASAVRDLGVERQLLRIAGALTSAGVPFLATGAVALARTAYPQPELRSLDRPEVLVAPADLARAQAIADDLSRTGPACAVHTLPVGDAGDVFSSPYRFQLGGYELEGLPMPHRLLLLCVSEDGADATARSRLRDVAELVVREERNVVDTLVLARAWDCERELAMLVATTWERLALAEGPKLFEWVRARVR